MFGSQSKKQYKYTKNIFLYFIKAIRTPSVSILGWLHFKNRCATVIGEFLIYPKNPDSLPYKKTIPNSL